MSAPEWGLPLTSDVSNHNYFFKNHKRSFLQNLPTTDILINWREKKPNYPDLGPRQFFNIHKNPHQLRDGECGVSVIQLDRNLCGERHQGEGDGGPGLASLTSSLLAKAKWNANLPWNALACITYSTDLALKQRSKSDRKSSSPQLSPLGSRTEYLPGLERHQT